MFLDRYCFKYNIDQETIIQFPQWQDNNDKITFYMFLSQHGIILKQNNFDHDPTLTDNQGKTVAMYLASNGIAPPKQWEHNPYLMDNNGKTVYDYFKEISEQVLKKWYIKKQIQMTDEIKQKLEEYCKQYEIEDQQIIIDDPSYQKFRGMNGDFTFAIWLADQKIIPPIEFLHRPSLYIKDTTVALQLASNGIIPQYQWVHSSEIQNFEFCTVAIQLAKKGIMPPKQWEHDPSIQDDVGCTVAMYLLQNNKTPPKQWQHNSDIQDCNGQTAAMYLASKGIIPPKEWEHDPTIKNVNNCTVALILASNGIEPPEIWKYDFRNELDGKYLTVGVLLSKYGLVPSNTWMHDIDIKDISGCTIRSNLTYWGYEYINGQFVHKYGTIDTIEDDTIRNMLYQYFREYKIQNLLNLIPSPEFITEDYTTFAMYLAKHNIDIPKNWHHNSEHIDLQNQTVALIMIKNKIDQQKLIYNQMSQYLLKSQASSQLKGFLEGYNLCLEEEEQLEMTKLEIQVKQQLDQYLSNQLQIPDEWLYESSFIDKEDNTAAMLIAQLQRIPNYQWQHDPLKVNAKKNSVAMYLAEYKIMPPKNWLHDVDKIKNIFGRTLRYYLANMGYICIQQQIQHITLINIGDYVETDIKDGTCQVCFNDGIQTFIQSTCKHNICSYCFQQMLAAKGNFKQCPCCRRNNWFTVFNIDLQEKFIKYIK